MFANRKFFNGALGLLAAAILYACASSSPPATPPTLPLFEDLGRHHYPVTTLSETSQRYFDQGLILAFGFNHAEAARSFREAYRLDPECALCYWGEALVLGPNINTPMDPADVAAAYAASRKASALSSRATDKEKALIEALTKRYSDPPPRDRAPLDQAYADAMRSAAERYPDDATVLSLYAEALMDLHPWDFWSKQGDAKPWTAAVVSVLERALATDADHPLANHLYIHAMEASPYAEKALPSARRLPSLVPGSGHLVHMPAHIYIRIGRYRDAILANQRAVAVDTGYLSHDHTESVYTLAYVPHNHHFLWAAAIKTGRKALSLDAGEETASRVDPVMLRQPGLTGTLQHFYSIPLYTRALFGDWDIILEQAPPPADLVYVTGIWHYARGLALLRKGSSNDATAELAMLEQTLSDPAVKGLTVFDLNPVSTLLEIGAAILHGELAAARGRSDEAIAHLQHAVLLEDGLNYTEPKDWYLPPRQVLGAILLEAGKPDRAEAVYRQDLVYHPQNGWSLFGLIQCLKAQSKKEEADAVQKQFDEVWADADVTLTGSRF
ncbi:MAG: hypothetical protein ACU84J_13745 [Gammaproteobacteria bacterium]